MNLDDLLTELQALIDKYADGTPEGTTGDEAAQDEERMAQLTSEIERITNEQKTARDARSAALAHARSAIESGNAAVVSNVPLARSANATGVVQDKTDYAAAYRRAWVKDVATRGGIQLAGGNDFNTVERAAFTHTTDNTGSVVPKEIQDQIITLIDNSAVLFGDASRSNLKNQFEIVRHKAITAGDAGKTNEGVAPTDEQNSFDTISLVGEEIKKTVKMSRKMAVQSMDGFEQYIINEVAARLSVAANAFCHERVGDAILGIASANKVTSGATKKLSKADITKALALLKTYGNPTTKGAIFYGNSDMIWNYLAMIEDTTGRSYFVDEKTEDPAVQGRIFGKLVKQDDSMADGTLLVGYPDLLKGNVFDGIDVQGYVATDGSQKHCFDGYLLYDCGLVVPEAFVEISVKQA
ncbi:phage major capsid protein [Olsenella sp. Marseille-P4559]|uniref:phage major capsid protein n=1 Tax=Olsenella sp. Marseille-P4559 TaxID=2364795 RepID=UPI00102F7C0F|nr:phage major capsid protein [Olsenella sp. Marseille-P4559]